MILLYTIFDSVSELYLFSLFGLIIIFFLALDLGIFNRKPQAISTKSAFVQSVFWIVISTLFGWAIFEFDGGKEPALEYFTAYLTEYALSVDNIFVIFLILKYFKVKDIYYHKILFWGIMGAVFFRAIFIFAGAILVSQFHWILYVFGAFLVYSGVKIYFEDEESQMDPSDSTVLRMSKKYLPFDLDDKSGRFFHMDNGPLVFTTLFLVIILIETTDLIFAVDSIPAAFAITQNEFLIYTSNIFAILGLRAKFFLLAGILDKFYLLQKGLSIVLVFIGVKMLLEVFEIAIPIGLSFVVIIGTLALSILLSLIIPEKNKGIQESEGTPVIRED